MDEEQEVEKFNEEDENENYDEEEERALERWSKKMKNVRGKQKEKVGRKSQWPTDLVNDLVDIILDNEKFKNKLLMTNVKNVKNSEYYYLVILELQERCLERNYDFNYDVKQTRDKFKRCVSSCREAALKLPQDSKKKSSTVLGLTNFLVL